MEKLSKKSPKLVAHRGFASEFPENSRTGFQAAVDAGCKFLELDVQLTRDLVPVIIHDENFLRTGGVDVSVLSSEYSAIKHCTVGEPERFADKFHHEELLSLEDFCRWLASYPDVKTFVEIKEESIASFGHKSVIQAIEPVLQAVRAQVFIISFDADFLFYAKQHANYPLGYVMHKFDEPSRQLAEQLQPEVLICNYKKIPDEANALWQGSWDWFLYEIIEPALALKWAERGVVYIETMQIAPMLSALSL